MAKEQGVNRGMITAIGAVSSNNMLGLAGWLPWDIPEELAYFEKTVAGAALLIGRLTYESMDVVPEPLLSVANLTWFCGLVARGLIVWSRACRRRWKRASRFLSLAVRRSMPRPGRTVTSFC